MKEMKENYVRDGLLKMAIYKQIDYLNEFADTFSNVYIEKHSVEWHTYLCDMICDGYELSTDLIPYRDKIVPTHIIRDINMWYSASEELMLDVRLWLRTECNIYDIYDRIQSYKKEGE